MSTVLQRFLDIPELVAALYPFLQNNDCIVLLRTSRLFHNLFAPLIWKNLKLTSSVAPILLLKSPEGIQALRRYADSVLTLETFSDFLKPYMDAVFEFARSSVDVGVVHVDEATQHLELLSLTHSASFLLSSATSGPVVAPPKWLLQHQSGPQQHVFDNNSNTHKNNSNNSNDNSDNISLPPLPPMTNLTKFHCSISRFHVNGDKLQSLQICWLLRLNPYLNDVQLVNVLLSDPDFARVFPRTLPGLTRLTHLHIDVRLNLCTPFETVKAIFESCPRSLEVLTMPFSTDCVTAPNQYSSANIQDQCEDNDDDTGFPVALRDGPLYRMKRLIMPTYRGGFPISLLEFFLKDCPSLEMWGVPPLESPVVSREAGDLLNLHCPNLRHLAIKDASRCRHQPQDFIQIINSMPPGHLETLTVVRFKEERPGELWEALGPHHHHQAGSGFRQLILFNVLSLSSRTIQALLRHCAGLKRLLVMGMEYRNALLSLEDAARFPWTCLNITSLCLSMDLSGTSADRKYAVAVAAAASESAAESPGEAVILSPFVWTTEEQECWRQLDRVYTSLGTLVHLDMLNLRHANQSSRDFMDKSLPGLLTLGDPEMNQPGFLRKLEGLKKLKTFRGSVWAFTDEMKMMLRQGEVEWMVAEWPALEFIDFLGNSDYSAALPAPLQWLKQVKPMLKLHWRE